MTLPLNEILASILSEFQSANVASDVNRAHWQEIYQNSPLLREFTPSRVRIADATVCIPLAIENIDELRNNDYGILPRQIALMLPERLGENRTRIADAVFEALSKRNKQFFFNPHLSDDLLDIVKMKCKSDLDDTELSEIQRQVRSLQQDVVARPHSARESNFQYRTSEISKISDDKLFKFEIKIIVD